MIIKGILDKFSIHKKTRIVHLNFFRGLLSKSAGKTMKSLTAWKNLPNKKDDRLLMRAVKMEKTLSHLV